MTKPLIVDLPYPDTSNLATDIVAGRIISFAYASLKGELNAILQYTYHSFYFAKYSKEYAQLMESIAIAEMMHLEMLGKTMLQLGVDPRYIQYPTQPTSFYDTSAVASSKHPKKMVMDDLEGELNAIADYQKMMFLLKNEEVAALIQRIVLDEQLHVEKLRELMQTINNRDTTTD